MKKSTNPWTETAHKTTLFILKCSDDDVLIKLFTKYKNWDEKHNKKKKCRTIHSETQFENVKGINEKFRM